MVGVTLEDIFEIPDDESQVCSVDSILFIVVVLGQGDRRWMCGNFVPPV